MIRTRVAHLVGDYIAFTRELYDSREWMNIRCALGRLIPNAREPDILV